MGNAEKQCHCHPHQWGDSRQVWEDFLEGRGAGLSPAGKEAAEDLHHSKHATKVIKTTIILRMIHVTYFGERNGPDNLQRLCSYVYSWAGEAHLWAYLDHLIYLPCNAIFNKNEDKINMLVKSK